MCKVLKALSGLVLMLALLGSLHGQEFEKGYAFDDSRVNSVKIRFELINNLIIIPLQINNSEPMHFIFDTGIKTAILTELGVHDSLTFTYNRVQNLQGLGEGRSVEAYPSFGNTISLDGITGKNQDIYVLGENDLKLSSRLGTKVNGIIGYDLIKDFVVEINYSNQYLLFHKVESYRPTAGSRTFVMPLEMVDNKPYVSVKVEISESVTIDSRLLVDLGGGFSIWLSPESDPRIVIPEERTRTYLGYGLLGEISGYIASVKSVQLGSSVFSKPIIAFPDSTAVINIVASEQRNGSLGAEILRRYNLVLDYGNKQIRLTPNSNFHDEFSFNRSGLEVMAPIPGARIYFISRVEPGSAAERCGIKVDDQLISINTRLASECSINDINAIFHGRSGKKLKMKLMRDGRYYKAEIGLGK